MRKGAYSRVARECVCFPGHRVTGRQLVCDCSPPLAFRDMNILNAFRRNEARQHYRQSGYQVFRSVLPRAHVDALATLVRDVIAPYRGLIQRQNGNMEEHDFFPGTSLIRNSLADAHLPISEAMRPVERALTTLLTSSELATVLQRLDGAEHYNIHQTLLFFAAQTTELHIDSWALDTAPRGFAHTLWIPLQDMDMRAGLPSVVPWPIGKVVTEEELGLSTNCPPGERYGRYQTALAKKVLSDRPEIVTAPVCKGDLIVWSSLTPHLTLPSLPFPAERLSLQVLLRPIHLRWGSFTDQPRHHPTNRHIRMTDHFSYFVHEYISRDYGIAGSLPEPASHLD